jgi:hypothetical protein
MATRGLIGYLDTDGDLKLTSTYCHYDSYPENLGKGLENFYNSDAKAEEVANVGYISFLDGETGEWDAKNQQIPDVTQLPDNFNDAMMEIAKKINSFGANYGYVWDNENQEWITVRNLGVKGMYRDLEMALAHLKGKFEIFPEQPEQTMEARSHYVSNEEADEDALNNWISDMLKYKSYDEVKQILLTSLINAEEELNTGEEELDEHFVHKMKYRAGIVK